MTINYLYALALFSCLVACGKEREADVVHPDVVVPNEAERPAEVFDGVVTLSARLDGGRRPLVVGITNLPDNSALMITLSRKRSSYSGQQKVNVANGAFQAGPFAQGEQDLLPGDYDLQISTPITMFQPNNVQAAFGPNGARLRGDLVTEAPTPFDEDRVVQYETNVLVTGATSDASDAKAREQERQNLEKWWASSCDTARRIIKRVADSEGKAFDEKAHYQKCLAEHQTTR